jgi:hypothetical protein
MATENNGFHTLARLIGEGDRTAEERLRQQLEPYLARIVGRALRPDSAATPLTRQLRAAATPLKPDERVARLAQAVATAVVHDCRPATPDSRVQWETVVGS